ncbi:hypothetical protein IAD21_04251 [Abditibacteriota bacterium]|nr:hypothetical protein IAD21_04251 [Abditibacteriota bacterium]
MRSTEILGGGDLDLFFLCASHFPLCPLCLTQKVGGF